MVPLFLLGYQRYARFFCLFVFFHPRPSAIARKPNARFFFFSCPVHRGFELASERARGWWRWAAKCSAKLNEQFVRENNGSSRTRPSRICYRVSTIFFPPFFLPLYLHFPLRSSSVPRVVRSIYLNLLRAVSCLDWLAARTSFH